MQYQDFIDGILPGNYALTKSMELTKVQTSGTLWYTKKFLVLYYYIFLTDLIHTDAYIEAIVGAFDGFIASLDPAVQAAAEKFFYTDDPHTNLKSDRFKKFSDFADFTKCKNTGSQRDYDRLARKFYFALLLGSGGQTGVKKKLKEIFCSTAYVFDETDMQQEIRQAVTASCIEQANAQHKVSDRSVKKLFSDAAIREIEALSNRRAVDERDVLDACARYPHPAPSWKAIRTDVIAFIRNERQILYYYGFVHSKSAGAKDYEFSSLTPVGDAAIRANYYEFWAIWEQQKLKMISQPPTAEINGIPAVPHADRFAIGFDPYLDILGVLLRRDSLSVEEYRYIVSRKNHRISEQAWEENEKEIFDRMAEIQKKVDAFGRASDSQDEDGRKELLKYLLGIRGDLGADRGKNVLGLVQYDKSTPTYRVCDRERLRILYRTYAKISDYKAKRYRALFEECEDDLRQRYVSASQGQTRTADPMTKIKWDLYNIRQDRFISLAVIFALSATVQGIDLTDAGKKDAPGVAAFAFAHFGDMLRRFSLKTVAKVKAALKSVRNALVTDEYAAFTDEEEQEEVVAAVYREEQAEDLLQKLRDLSRANARTTGERRRNPTLKSLLKSYYGAVLGDVSLLRCECCGEPTFPTDANEPYTEFHHLIPFRLALGPDHYLNLYALCPNCHRKLHFLHRAAKPAEFARLDRNNYLALTIVERLQLLKKEGILCSYHLEYLLAEKAISPAQYIKVAT